MKLEFGKAPAAKDLAELGLELKPNGVGIRQATSNPCIVLHGTRTGFCCRECIHFLREATGPTCKLLPKAKNFKFRPKWDACGKFELPEILK